jgi:hypothetical protein
LGVWEGALPALARAKEPDRVGLGEAWVGLGVWKGVERGRERVGTRAEHPRAGGPPL